MSAIVNFKSFKVEANSVNDAKEQVNDFYVDGSADIAFRKFKEGREVVSDTDLTDFMVTYLDSKKNRPKTGYYITLVSAVADTRERPYTVVKHKRPEGKREYKTVYHLVNTRTGLVEKEITTTAGDAEKAGKEMMKNGFADNLQVKIVKVTKDPILMDIKYTPSKGARKGEYLFFGNIAD